MEEGKGEGRECRRKYKELCERKREEEDGGGGGRAHKR